MKKKILLLAMLVLCVAILATGTLAYFTDEDTAHNVITSGGVDIVIEEWQEVGDELLPYPDEPIVIMPGAVVSKIAQVRNLDAQSWIRARLEIVVYDAQGEVMALSDEALAAVISLEFNRVNWQEPYVEDGWYYYNAAVGTGESTEPIFTAVNFVGENMGNEFQNCTVNIQVIAQAVQTANNGTFALEAEGWPKD